MGLISDLLGGLGGRKSAPRTIADVEAALSRLSSERTTARQAVAAAMRERDELLLVDETDKTIARLDADADRARLIIERCDRAEPLILRELEELRTEAKQARWRSFRAQYDAAARDYAAALRTLLEKMAVMMNVHDAARAAGHEHEAQAIFVAPARLLTIESLNAFEAAIERSREMARPIPAPAPKPLVAAPKAAAPAQKPVAAAPKATPKAERQRVVEEAGPGEILMRVQRDGYTKSDDGKQYRVNDIVAVSAETARIAAQRGALDGALQ